MKGGCDCQHVRFEMKSKPMVVHCCHCRWCQRESGASFALNAMIESSRLHVINGHTEMILTPSASGKGQKIHRCPKCKVALWSHYPSLGELTSFVRVGTLDEPDQFPPDIHIFTASKQPWVVLPEKARAFAEFYDIKKEWTAEALERREKLLKGR